MMNCACHWSERDCLHSEDCFKRIKLQDTVPSHLSHLHAMYMARPGCSRRGTIYSEDVPTRKITYSSSNVTCCTHGPVQKQNSKRSALSTLLGKVESWPEKMQSDDFDKYASCRYAKGRVPPSLLTAMITCVAARAASSCAKRVRANNVARLEESYTGI
jgi:hypothetical protein